MLTEDDARKKWCPFARVVERQLNGVTSARNRVVNCGPDKEPVQIIDSNLAGAQCIASDCMAWRWASTGLVETDNSPNGVLVSDRVGAEKCGWKILRDLPDTGYCGLAGVPQ